MAIIISFSTDDEGNDHIAVNGVAEDASITVTVHRETADSLSVIRQATVAPPEINLVEADLDGDGLGTLPN